MTLSDEKLPHWHYEGPDPLVKQARYGNVPLGFPPLDGPNKMDLGGYVRPNVSNTQNPKGRTFFNLGLRLMLSYQHEMASKCFLACLEHSPYCVLAHALVALCHSPNYNFKGDAYYESANHPHDVQIQDLLCTFPSQQVADRHSKAAVDKIEYLRKIHRKANKSGGGGKGKKKGKGKQQPQSAKANNNGNGTENPDDENAIDETPQLISDLEAKLVVAIRVLCCQPGLSPSLSEEMVGRPYADAMRKVYQKYPNDPDVAYCFAESLMVLNAWQLFEYPTGKAVSPDVTECHEILEKSLKLHSHHAGLCHMYVHLSEMSANPAQALEACKPLRCEFPHAGHLIHMATHIDVLVGDNENCFRYNYNAILADEQSMRFSPQTSGKESFYFGYIVHNYHMAVYSGILGAYEKKSMELATKLSSIVDEAMFVESPYLTAYLESYSALEIHTMIRFGRWKELLEIEPPKDKKLMLYRAASIKFARSLALAALGDIAEARKEADRFDSIRKQPDAEDRILHNNSVADLLAVDAAMLRGEILYREGKHDQAFVLLRTAVKLQDDLNYDEPWGKMQPTRHALGGLLLEQGHVGEAEEVFRKDLLFHPRNPWGIVGLLGCLKKKLGGGCCGSGGANAEKDVSAEISELEEQLTTCRKSDYMDFDVVVACECCKRETN
ncbi:domain protein [Seminavis robusta]|uniref:Domain protein n=1 Tax=Seminavis robusta TaxID=568900 RepID=A0A9N8EE58_9STRA|nr:domain protein [Seminavis robusta]|eukprot:Sro869_g213440.1 domain protein (667) ;mRNA; r:10175-12684